MNLRYNLIIEDISTANEDAIVNPTDRLFTKMIGNNASIFETAGNDLINCLENLGEQTEGTAIVTDAFDLPCKKLIHLIGPTNTGNKAESSEILHSAYKSAFKLINENGFNSVAIPELSDTIYGLDYEEKIIVLAEELQDFVSKTSFSGIISIYCRARKGFNAYKLLLEIDPKMQATLFDLLKTFRIKQAKLSKSLTQALTKEESINIQLNKAHREILKQKEDINTKSGIIAEQYKELSDSINRAALIIKSISPPAQNLKELVPDCFILNMPKNVIGGDFFWFTKADNNILVITVADCTGHGVPGALLSMLGVSFLNEIVISKRQTDPIEIIDHLRERIIKTLQENGNPDELRDGMDLALCTVDPEKKVIEFSGANNPLFHVRNYAAEPDNESENQEESRNTTKVFFSNDRKVYLKEYKADKMPVAANPLMETFDKDPVKFKLKRKLHVVKLKELYPFHKHVINYQEGDTFYMFSDGYADQFGGPSGKKLMSAAFKKLLMELNGMNMDEQKTCLENFFKNWKGDIDQVDDVLIVGIRL